MCTYIHTYCTYIHAHPHTHIHTHICLHAWAQRCRYTAIHLFIYHLDHRTDSRFFTESRAWIPRRRHTGTCGPLNTKKSWAEPSWTRGGLSACGRETERGGQSRSIRTSVMFILAHTHTHTHTHTQCVGKGCSVLLQTQNVFCLSVLFYTCCLNTLVSQMCWTCLDLANQLHCNSTHFKPMFSEPMFSELTLHYYTCSALTLSISRDGHLQKILQVIQWLQGTTYRSTVYPKHYPKTDWW